MSDNDPVFWILSQYSEWLDQQHLIVGDEVSDDKRSHDQLVKDFLRQEVDGA